MALDASVVDVIQVLVEAETAKAIQGLQRTETQSDKLTNSLKKVGSTLSKTVTPALIAVAGLSVKAASDLGESINAVNVVFKDAAGTIEDFGETAADAIGLSQNSFNELATVIGAQLKQSGLDIDTVADQTVNLTTRAADLASVFNVDVTQAAGALGAALRGETEPARQFGINISDAAVQAEALASGLVNSKNEITDQIKVQARLALIYKQSADVAGDFQNTSDSLANTTRILKANLENTAAELGQAFLPIVSDAASGALELVKGFNDLDDGTKKIIITLAGLVAVSGPVATAITAIGTALNVSAGPVGAAFVAFGLLLTTVLKLKSEFNELADTEEAISNATSGAASSTEEYDVALAALATKLETARQQEEALAKSGQTVANSSRASSQALTSSSSSVIEAKQKEAAALEAQLDLVQRNRDAFEKSEEAKAQAAQQAFEDQIQAQTEAFNSLLEGEQEQGAEINNLREYYAQLDREREDRRFEYSRDKSLEAIQYWRDYEEEKTRISEEEATQRERDAKESQQALYNGLTSLANDYYNSIKALGDDATKEQKDRAKAAFRVSQAVSISEAIINTATAITKAYASLGPFGAPAAAALAVIGAAQVGLIASEKPAFATGGQFLTSSSQTFGGATVGDNAGGVERVTVEPISSRDISGIGTSQTPIVIQIDSKPIYEGLLRSSQDGVALIDQRAVI